VASSWKKYGKKAKAEPAMLKSNAALPAKAANFLIICITSFLSFNR
jgi:hypothetical protein